MCLGIAVQATESERDLEQDLLALVDYDKFALVKQLIRNRATIVWCTRLARAENEDVEKRIEVPSEKSLPLMTAVE